MNNVADVLPNKPSELISVALRDLEKVQKMKTRKIEMSQWVTRTPNNKMCAVCLAGAVMDRTMGATKALPNLRCIFPTDLAIRGIISRSDRGKLKALNLMREGEVNAGLSNMGVTEPLGDFNRAMPEFRGKGTKFKAAMRQLAKDLKSKGL